MLMSIPAILATAILLTAPSLACASDRPLTRYPTADETYYVLACMEMNGQNADGLHKCSCAINAIEAQLRFRDYSDAELVLALRQAGGRDVAVFRDTAPMKKIIGKFLQAQRAANEQCFGPSGVGENNVDVK
jgi:hypothetical protein